MQHSQQTEVDPLDRIDRSIDIDAPAARVWGARLAPRVVDQRGRGRPRADLVVTDDQALLRHPVHGEFRLHVLDSRPPSYVSYRWMDGDAEVGTLVEFWIEPREGGVTLRVAESGFSGLGKAREDWLAHRAGNVEGWTTELAAARTWVDRAGDAR